MLSDDERIRRSDEQSAVLRILKDNNINFTLARRVIIPYDFGVDPHNLASRLHLDTLTVLEAYANLKNMNQTDYSRVFRYYSELEDL